MGRLPLAAAFLALAIFAGSAAAQAANDNPPTPAQTAHPEMGTATINPTGIPPSQRNPLLADNGDVRIGKLVGTNVYNKDDKKVGSVDDVLAGQNGQLQAVIATNDKKVLVPWNDLQFGDAKLNSDNKVLMPNATANQLNKMPTFTYQKQNKS